jgi:hypothetical protein
MGNPYDANGPLRWVVILARFALLWVILVWSEFLEKHTQWPFTCFMLSAMVVVLFCHFAFKPAEPSPKPPLPGAPSGNAAAEAELREAAAARASAEAILVGAMAAYQATHHAQPAPARCDWCGSHEHLTEQHVNDVCGARDHYTWEHDQYA